ncbi:hypothetical protein [Streptomyces sp. NPDC060322]|uniref:hypothetical protein n=1 Tax=Streptomyces sp. NPDC060322 TaxID=3347097 RepID=UPI0036597B73
MSSETEDTMVAALLRERAGYVSRGMGDRVTQVDEQLALRGYKPDKEAAPVSRATPPKNRRQRSPETT